MNQTEERVVEILTSHPRCDMPWTVPMKAVGETMKWDIAKTRAFVEYLMYHKLVVLKTVGLHKLGEQENKGQFWWERGERLRQSARKL